MKRRQNDEMLHKPRQHYEASLNLSEVVKNDASYDKVQQMIDLRINFLEVKDSQGKTALMHAVINNNVDRAKLLLTTGADVSALDSDCSTVLMHAVSHVRDIDFIKTLIQKSENILLINNQCDTALLLACRSNNPEVVDTLLKHGANVADKNKYGDTPLMVATLRNSVPIIKILLSSGADVQAINKREETALFKVQTEESLRLLLKAGSDPEAVNVFGMPVSMYLVQLESQNTVGYISQLIKAGADPSNEDLLNNTVLLHVCNCTNEELESVEFLLKKGVDPSHENDTGLCPLSNAIDRGHLNVVQLLLHAGANPSSQDKFGLSLLMRVCKNYHQNVESILKLLLEAGANVSARNHEGSTALLDAVILQRIDLVEHLLAAGANPSQEDKTGNSALTQALRCDPNNVKLVELLENFNASSNEVLNLEGKLFSLCIAIERKQDDAIMELLNNINLRDSNGENMLMFACRLDSENIELVELLIKHESLLSAQNNVGATALMVAFKTGHLLILKTLVDAGAPISTQDRLGNTLLMLACAEGNLELVNLLLKNGASAAIKNRDGKTAAIIAAVHNKSDCLRALLVHGCSVANRDKHGTSVLSLFIMNNCFNNNPIQPDFDLTLRYIIDYGTQFDEIDIVPEAVRVYLMFNSNNNYCLQPFYTEFFKELVKKVSDMIHPESTYMLRRQRNIHQMLLESLPESLAFKFRCSIFYIVIASPFRYVTWTKNTPLPPPTYCFDNMLRNDLTANFCCETMGYLISLIHKQSNFIVKQNTYELYSSLFQKMLENGYKVNGFKQPSIMSPLTFLVALKNWNYGNQEKYVYKLVKQLLARKVTKCQYLLSFKEPQADELRQALKLPDSLWMAFQSGYTYVLPLLAPYWSVPTLALFRFLPSLSEYDPAERNVTLKFAHYFLCLHNALIVLEDISGPLPPGHPYIPHIQNYLQSFAEIFRPARHLSENFRKLHRENGPPSLQQLCRHVVRGCTQTGDDLPQRLASLEIPRELISYVGLVK